MIAQFSSDLDEDTRSRLRHGERIVETLKQKQYKPFSLVHEILVLFAMQNRCLDDVKIENVLDFEDKMLEYLEIWHMPLIETLKAQNEITAELEEKLLAGINQFKVSYQFERQFSVTPS